MVPDGDAADPADGRPAVFAPGELEMDFEGADEHDHGSTDHSHSHDHFHAHEKSTGVGGEVKNEHLHLQRDLTSVGSKADLLESRTTAPRDGHGVFHDNVNTLRQSKVERVVRFVLDSNFHKASMFVSELLHSLNTLSKLTCDQDLGGLFSCCLLTETLKNII